jgi:Protein of unknown function (DUF3306)
VSEAPTGRLARWSQRKSAARRGSALPAESDVAAVPPAADSEQAARDPHQEKPAAPPASAEAPPAAAEPLPQLPPIEELTFQSDFTVFMAKNVPEALKRAALRKLWTSDPVLANLDGLNDYCEDHHLIDTSITLDQTSYKVGKGYFDEVEEKLAKLDDKPPAHAAERSAENSESHAAAGSGDAGKLTVSESDAGGDEQHTAPQQVAAAVPEDATPEPDEDAPA